jgi:hypothetical protein
VKVYNFLPTLVVNNDQTHVHPIPITRERTWESKRSKQIQILRVENKIHITMVVFSARNGFKFPLKLCSQILFIVVYHHFMKEKTNA